MSGFIIGEERTQSTLFPGRLEDYVDEENPVCVIDAFIDTLDLSGVGCKTVPEQTGRQHTTLPFC